VKCSVAPQQNLYVTLATIIKKDIAMRITILLIITFLCFQCSNSRKNDPNEQHLAANLVFYGNGESGVAGFYNEWAIKILDKNLVEMLCSMKEDSLDIRSMNRQ